MNKIILFLASSLFAVQSIYSQKPVTHESVNERFIRYAQIETSSDPTSNTYPSTSTQYAFAKIIGEELSEVGLTEIVIDSNAYVYCTLPSNLKYEAPVIGLLAHIDTEGGLSGKNVHPLIHKNYDGNPIILKNNITISTDEFPELKQYIGQDFVTADGTTLLGADDKAGIAEIINAMEFLLNNKNVPHGKIRICFTPDEEISRDVERFNTGEFGADFAYTIDGTEIGEIKYENFNGAKANIAIEGRNFHTGYAKNKLINATLIGQEFISMLPSTERPETTVNYEGFYHLLSLNGNVEKAELYYWIRDFDLDGFQKRKGFMNEIVKYLNLKYGYDAVSIDIRDEYFNMYDKIKQVPNIVDLAKKSMITAQVTPKVMPIRGGSTGARLTFKGLPCPNLFTGVQNMHSLYEYIPVQSMDKAVEVIVNICKFGSDLNIQNKTSNKK